MKNSPAIPALRHTPYPVPTKLLTQDYISIPGRLTHSNAAVFTIGQQFKSFA